MFDAVYVYPIYCDVFVFASVNYSTFLQRK